MKTPSRPKKNNSGASDTQNPAAPKKKHQGARSYLQSLKENLPDNVSNQGASSTPSRNKAALVLQSSPVKSPTTADFNAHESRYLEDRLSPVYFDQRSVLLEKFENFLSASVGVPYSMDDFSVRKNTIQNPYELLSINTHSTFCDRNHGDQYSGTKGFLNALTQCCSLATRREGMSVVFLRNPRKIHRVGLKDRHLFCRTSEPNPSEAVFCIDCVPEWMNTLCQSIEAIYVNAPKDQRPNKSLVINTGFFTVEGEHEGHHLVKTMAVITANGIYQSRQARNQMEKIEAAIKDVRPDIEVMIVDMDEMPQVKSSGTYEHCETVFANLLQSISGSSPRFPDDWSDSSSLSSRSSVDALTDVEMQTSSSENSDDGSFTPISLSDALSGIDLDDGSDSDAHPISNRQRLVKSMKGSLAEGEQRASDAVNNLQQGSSGGKSSSGDKENENPNAHSSDTGKEVIDL